MEAADRIVIRHAALRPWRPEISFVLDEGEPVAVRPFKTKALLAERFLAFQPGYALLGQPFLPIAERSFRHRKDGRADLPDTMTALSDIGEREIGHDRTGRAELVRIVKVIDVRRVEVDGFLDPAKAKLVGEELIVLARVLRHRSDVVQALDLVEHGGSLLFSV